jgi:carbon starvation protein
MLKKLLWLFLSLLAGGSLAVIAKALNTSEPVNALWLVTASACIFVLAYRFYARFVCSKILSIDPSRPTPAVRLKDGTDYDPTNRWMLFGHHFAAIAGAGPLIGPMLAAQFGYLPGFLWILIGATLAGSVHDTVILFASVRKDGKSLAQIAKQEIGPVGGITASIAIIFIIIVALAGLGLAVVNALADSPWGTFTIFLTIPIALSMGIYLKSIRPGRVAEMSVIGVVLLVSAVVIGQNIPHSSLASFFTLSRNKLVYIMAAYGFFASVLPVWMLLCPRDYLSTYMKIGTIILLAAGIISIAPHIQMPAVTKFVSGGGPVIPGKLFPFMFITIACGAISGFHSLIASGTTPKMILSEKDIPAIGFGAMLTEGFVAIIALVAATILIPGDYFAINTKLSFAQLANIGFPVSRIQELSQMVGINVAGRPGGAVSLAVGMSSILGNIRGMRSLMPYWYNFALMFEALFILTTVDAGTRVARFLLQEFGGAVYKPLSRTSWLPGVLMTSFFVVLSWGYLIYSGSVSTIWPMFGVSNQLLAALALGVGTTVIIRMGKSGYAWVTFVPMVFMFVTTFTASWQLSGIFYQKLLASQTISEIISYKIDIFLLSLMALLAIISLADMLYKWYRLFGTVENTVKAVQQEADQLTD